MVVWWWALVACGPSPVDPAAGDTVVSADTPPIDTPPTDTPPTDTPPVHPPADTPPADTPADSVAPPPPDLGAGFVDLIPQIAADLALAPDPPPGSRQTPDQTWVTFGDLGDDGVVDLVLGQVLRPASDVGDRVGAVYTYEQGALVFHAAHTEALHRAPGAITAVLDLDGDGDTDMVRASTESTFQLASPDGWSTWDLGVPAGVAFLGGLWTGNAMDIDQDGWLDWMFMPDPCSGDVHWSSLPVLRTGPSSWQLRDDLVSREPAGDAYATIMAPLGGERPWIVQLGQGCDEFAGPPDFLASARGADGELRYAFIDPTPADALFRLRPGGAGFNISRHQPMGGAVVDLDHDDVLELVVSLAEEEVTVLSAGEPMTDLTPGAGLTLPIGWGQEPELPWGVAPIDLDQDGSPDLVFAHGDDGRIWFATNGHADHPLGVWWNDGAGFFQPMRVAGLDAVGDWRSVTFADFDADGDPDLAVGGFGRLPAILRNDVDLGRHVLTLTLGGTTSNHLGLGARVVVEADGLVPQTRLMGETASPDAVSPAALYFGLGAARSAQVTVTWPSGVVQEATLSADAPARLVEPPLITLSEADRHAEPGAPVTVEVTPRAPDGSLRAVQAVTIDSPWSAVTWTGPAARDGDVWRRTFVAPSDGSVVIEVAVDGEVVPIHPRVWVD